MDNRSQDGTEKKRAALHNLGCKVNAYEMDVMEELLRESGYEIVPFEEDAEVYIINTCTVTNIADRKSRQMLHRAKKAHPNSIVVAVGCYVQTDLEGVLKDAGVDLCIGNNKKGEIVSILRDYLNLNDPVEKGTDAKTLDHTSVINVNEKCEYEDLLLKNTTDRTRAYIKIQDGCNQFCTYCIIPFSRGRVRSRKKEKIIEEIKGLCTRGFKEFVITGIHVSSYGSDIEHPDKRMMANQFSEKYLQDLLREVEDIPEVQRIRLSSLEPRIMTEEFVRFLSGMKKLCPHFHLSLQSGCDATLRRMNRQYTTEEFLQTVERLRRYFDQPAITTDVIVGFPGETEEEFAQTRAFLEKVNFYEMHIFKYSKRRGTYAAGMSGQLTEAQKAKRSDELEQIEKRSSEAFRASYTGKCCEVLFEETRTIGLQTYRTGHTREYIKVAVISEDDLSGKICPVRLTGLVEGEWMGGVLC